MALPIRDKVAVVFHGIVGGMSDRNGVGLPVDIGICAKTIQNVLLKDIDYDVFIHSWSTDHGDSILNTYHPIIASFDPQEYFGFSKDSISSAEVEGQAFRTISRYTSMKRAIDLKRSYELELGFRYKWVLVLRFDLIFFTPLVLADKSLDTFYICTEPHWPCIHTSGMMHDIVFLSSSPLMDEYSTILDDMLANRLDASVTHIAAYKKIMSILESNPLRLQYGFRRYLDVEIYRMIVNPQLNPVGHAYGALETKPRLDILLQTLGV